MTGEWGHVKRKRWSGLSRLKRKVNTANVDSPWNFIALRNENTYRACLAPIMCSLHVPGIWFPLAAVFSCLKTRVSSRTPSGTETSKLRQMTCCSLWWLQLYRVLPHVGRRSAHLQGPSTGAGAATQDDSRPFPHDLLRNCEARFHVSLPPFFSKQTFLFLFIMTASYLHGWSPLCSNFKTGPLNLNIILKSE